MQKAVAYLATRNLYDLLPAAYNSLIAHNPDVHVYLLIEDDTFPLVHPDNVTVMNVGHQTWFPESGPNYQSMYSYMVLLKCAMTKIFPKLDRILVLDADTIVTDSISDLWDLDLTCDYYAAVVEPRTSEINGRLYCNAGVLMLNLQKLRQDGMDDDLINVLNTRHFSYPEQDAINELCGHFFTPLVSAYNDTSTGFGITRKPEVTRIIHYAGIKNWNGFDPVREYTLRSVTYPKIVVYAGNRRYYHNLVCAAKSLLEHSPVDRIYFLTEDDTFPEPLPDIIQCINVSNQNVFHVPGPNISGYYSYMTTLRAGLTKILPDVDRILWLDPDTIVTDDISPIWNYDISSYCFAAVQETRNNTHTKKPYYNAGTMLMNLDFMRKTGIDQQIINTINTTHYTHLEQDVLNFTCDGQILDLPPVYNASFVSDPCKFPRIKHYLDRAKADLPEAQKPYDVPWNKIMFVDASEKA